MASSWPGTTQQGEEPVHLSRDPVPLDGDSGLLQPIGVGLALIAQDVVFGGEHDRRGNPAKSPARSGEASGSERRSASGR
jgi:hypothetical protein